MHWEDVWLVRRGGKVGKVGRVGKAVCTTASIYWLLHCGERQEVEFLPSNISGSVPLGLAASPAHVSFPKNKKLPLNSTCSPIQIAAASNEHAVRRNSSHGV